MPRKDYSGVRFGRFVVVGVSARWHRDNQLWICRCDCGDEKHVALGSLRSGRSQSCGCRFVEVVSTHRMSNTRTYQSWNSMIQRCTNSRNTSHARYGRRGITVCDRWLNSFDAFLADMGERPDGMTLDRIDNDRGYEPGNCHWATPTAQNRNSRHSKLNIVAVCLIRHLGARGVKQADLAYAFGVTPHHVSVLLSRKTWADTFHMFPRGTAHPELAHAA